MYNSIELLLNNAVDHTTRVKFAQAIMYAQAIIEASWRGRSETQETGEYTLSRGVAAVLAQKEFELPEYLRAVLDDLLHDCWNESGEFADYVLEGETSSIRLRLEVKAKVIMRNYGLTFSPYHSHGGMPALEGYVTEDFHKWLLRVICSNNMSDPWYQRKTGVNPFFQGGSTYEGDGWVLIEFWTKDIHAARKYCEAICLEYCIQLTGDNND